MRLCRICGNVISDYDIIVDKGLAPPKLCEVCRHMSKKQRNRTKVRHELIASWIVRLDKIPFRMERIASYSDASIPHAKIMSLGGYSFGPWGGKIHSGKYLFYAYTDVEEGAIVQLRKMRKINLDKDKEWIYFVIQPANGAHPTHTLKFMFTRMFKKAFKEGDKEFDNLKVLESDDIILSGSSIARDGKFGNDWVLYLTTKEE